MELSTPDRIWNRAALEDGGPHPRPGDRGLTALLHAHGLVMNGGVLHAIEALDDNELLDAVSGYRFFGLEAAARILEEAAAQTKAIASEADEEALERHADARYNEAVADDGTLVAVFERLYHSSPEMFNPA